MHFCLNAVYKKRKRLWTDEKNTHTLILLYRADPTSTCHRTTPPQSATPPLRRNARSAYPGTKWTSLENLLERDAETPESTLGRAPPAHLSVATLIVATLKIPGTGTIGQVHQTGYRTEYRDIGIGSPLGIRNSFMSQNGFIRLEGRSRLIEIHIFGRKSGGKEVFKIFVVARKERNSTYSHLLYA